MVLCAPVLVHATGLVLTFPLSVSIGADAAADGAAAAAGDTGAEVGRGKSGGEEPDQRRRRAARLHHDQGSDYGDG